MSDLPQSVLGSLGTSFSLKGSGVMDRTLSYWFGILVVVWGALLASHILPKAQWVDIVSMVVGAISGFGVRHNAAPPS